MYRADGTYKDVGTDPHQSKHVLSKDLYNYFPTKILGLPMALVWDNTRFQCLWLDRDVKINYRIFMSYIILLHATLQLWQPKKCMNMNFSESYFKKKLPTTLRLGSKPKINNLGYHRNQGSCGILWTPLFFYDSSKSGWQNVNFAKYIGTWKISPADALSKRLKIPTYSIIQYLKVCWKYGEVLLFCIYVSNFVT